MNKNEAEGHGKELKGKAKEAAGELTGNERLEADGEADQVEGKVQKNAGKVEKAVKGN